MFSSSAFPAERLPPRLSMQDYIEAVEMLWQSVDRTKAARQKKIEKSHIRPFQIPSSSKAVPGPRTKTLERPF